MNADNQTLDLTHYTVEALTIEDIEINALPMNGDGESIGEFDLIKLGE